MSEIKKGDVVRLRGSNVTMTVEAVNGNGIVECIWHDAQGVLHEHSFYPETLQKAQEDLSRAV